MLATAIALQTEVSPSSPRFEDRQHCAVCCARNPLRQLRLNLLRSVFGSFATSITTRAATKTKIFDQKGLLGKFKRRHRAYGRSVTEESLRYLIRGLRARIHPKCP